jgi:NADPH-dependent 2,4-dienoyl-CoA reductase/sulfur reductase-like enzyme
VGERRSFDVVIAGAGPAGMAAAWAARRCGASVAVVDDNCAPGGQIWRAEHEAPSTPQAAEWFGRIGDCGAHLFSGAAVVDSPAPRRLLLTGARGSLEVDYGKLILATGARERFLPFPGWTLPGVFGAGGLQSLVKGGLRIAGKRIVVAGSGPLLLAAASYFAQAGAEVLCVAEQTPLGRLMRFAIALLSSPSKLAQAARLYFRAGGAPMLTSTWPVAARGHRRVESVTLRRPHRTLEIPCDCLACGFGLVPNTELASLLGCEIRDGAVVVDAAQRTSVDGVYCAGEPAGIGGVDAALVEGQIAGYDACGRSDLALTLVSMRERGLRFRRDLARAFELRRELASVARDDTIVCRCEDVAFGLLKTAVSWRSAKLHTRCGMGPCQGRTCGPAVEFIFGWRPESVRPPIFPATVEALSGANTTQ